MFLLCGGKYVSLTTECQLNIKALEWTTQGDTHSQVILYMYKNHFIAIFFGGVMVITSFQQAFVSYWPCMRHLSGLWKLMAGSGKS